MPRGKKKRASEPNIEGRNPVARAEVEEAALVSMRLDQGQDRQTWAMAESQGIGRVGGGEVEGVLGYFQILN